MARFIAQNYTQPLTAETIGQHVGLHPNYAMALFQQTFGTTLIKYVTQHRLSHAQRLLVTTKDVDREHRVQFRLRLAQPLQRGIPAVLRLHAARIPQSCIS